MPILLAIVSSSGIWDILYHFSSMYPIFISGGDFGLLKIMFVLIIWFNFLIVILLMSITFCFYNSFISVIEHRDRSLFFTTPLEVFSFLWEKVLISMVWNFFSFSNVSACFFVAISMRMVLYFRFLTEMEVIIEEMFFSIIKGDKTVSRNSFDCSTEEFRVLFFLVWIGFVMGFFCLVFFFHKP